MIEDRWMRSISVCLGALLSVGCEQAGNIAGEDTGDDTLSGGDDGLPGPDDLEDGWNELQPGGDTVCARGTPFAFFVHPGTVNKVVVDFMGGGACWDETTCGTDLGIFTDSVAPYREAIDDGFLDGFGRLDGIYNRDREENPFKDWHHVIIPYCTGDVHWGDVTAEYGDLQIEHRGAVNVRAVLEWVYRSFPDPDQIVATGCSAGSLGSALWSAHLMQHYPKTRVIQFGDSNAGVITEDFFQRGFLLWNAGQAYPDWIPGFDPSGLDTMYIDIAGFYPNNYMSQFNFADDEVQSYYLELMGGGDAAEWTRLMLASLEAIEDHTDNFAAFVAEGDQHCILPREQLYTIDAQGTRLIDWLGELLSEGSVRSVRTETP